MKYGKALENDAIEAYRHLYLDYKNLKREIKKSEARKRQAIQASSRIISKEDESISSTNVDSVFVPNLLKVPFHALKTDSVKVTAQETLPFGDNMFAEAFEQELDKVDGFYLMKCLEMDTRINGVYCRIVNVNAGLKRKKLKKLNQEEINHLVADAKEALRVEIVEAEAISEQVKHIAKFARQNSIGFKKIAKKYNKRVCEGSLQWLSRVMEKRAFYVSQFDVLILGISDVYRVINSLQQKIINLKQDEKDTGAWVPPTEFKRRTEKYWVHPDYITEVKVMLAQHIPILIFGRDNKKEDEERLKKFGARAHIVFKDASLFQHYDSESNVSSLISSAYYDNSNHECYHERLHKNEGAILVRARWYGAQEPTKKLFLERKVHHEKESGESSVKERFEIPFSDLPHYMEGSWSMNERKQNLLKKMSEPKVNSILQLANSVQTNIIEKNLVPVLRTTYIRTSFQGQDSNDFRATFDTHLCLTREDQWKNKNSLFRTFDETMNPNDVFLFPKAVLELKFATGPDGEELPAAEWVNQLLALPGVEKAKKFSKFIHASASLYSRLLEIDPPSWFTDIDEQLNKHDDTQEFSNDESKQLNIYNTVKLLNNYKDSEAITLENVETITPRKADEQKKIKAVSYKEDSPVAPKKKKQKQYSNYAELEEDEAPTKTTSKSGSFLKKLNLPFFSGDVEEASLTKKQQKDMLQHIKTSMANERTLLNWMSPIILLLSVSISLLGLGGAGARVFALIIGGVAVIFSLYSLFMFHMRRRALLLKKMNKNLYDDPFGPSLLVFLLIAALGSSAIISYVNNA